MIVTNKEVDEKRAKLLVERLKEYPELSERFERILSLAENEDGSANTADEAEERAMEEVRKLGQELMQSWAENKHKRIVSEYDLRSGVRRKGKKLYWQTRFGRVTLFEQVYQSRNERKQLRPFQSAARVSSRSLSLGLQRAIADFGADSSFSSASEKVREHYGVDVSISSVRKVTQQHGFAMQARNRSLSMNG